MRVVVRLAQAALVVLVVVAVVGAWHTTRRYATRRAAAKAAASRDLVLGPAGIGKLKLGMSEKQATATGEATISPGWRSGNSSTCISETVDGVTIMFSRRHGLAVLSGPERTRTPEGVRTGVSLAEVVAAYPTVNHPDLGTPQEQVQLVGNFTTPVPGNPDAIYVFIFNMGGTRPEVAKLRLILLSLRAQDQECTRAD